MTTSGLSADRLDRLRTILEGHVGRGARPGLVSVVSRRGEAHVDVIGRTAVDGGIRRAAPTRSSASRR